MSHYQDFVPWIIIVAIIMILCFCCAICRAICCKREEEPVFVNSPVVVTSATHTAPGGYPVTQMPPMSGYQTNVYATAYPAQNMPTQMPMPMPMQSAQGPQPGMPPHMTPYPPAASGSMMNPPSYDAAMAGGPSLVPGPTATAYEKQSPYNPSFTAQ